MNFFIAFQKQSTFTRTLISFLALTFAFSMVAPSAVYAQGSVQLPVPGTMVSISPAYTPPIIQGITIDSENPLKFDFLISSGDEALDGEALKEESLQLIRYFLASLTVPEDQMWVNLSPYESDRIVPEDFGRTEMGRDLLAQDYLLKQLTASLMYPEKELGKEFWKRVHAKAQRLYGTTEVPMNTFNKIWIVPDTAKVYVNGQNVFVVDSHLKVMIEEDYLALEHHTAEKSGDGSISSGLTSEIVREVLIPEIEVEVNRGKTFANLRQIFSAVVLATWYKRNLKQSFLGKNYVDQAKTNGIDSVDTEANQKIYNQYVEAFETGVYNFVKEEHDALTDEVIPRKYFSGGVNAKVSDLAMVTDADGLLDKNLIRYEAELRDSAMTSDGEFELTDEDVADLLEAFKGIYQDLSANQRLLNLQQLNGLQNAIDQYEALEQSLTPEARTELEQFVERTRALPDFTSAESQQEVEEQYVQLFGSSVSSVIEAFKEAGVSFVEAVTFPQRRTFLKQTIGASAVACLVGCGGGGGGGGNTQQPPQEPPQQPPAEFDRLRTSLQGQTLQGALNAPTDLNRFIELLRGRSVSEVVGYLTDQGEAVRYAATEDLTGRTDQLSPSDITALENTVVNENYLSHASDRVRTTAVSALEEIADTRSLSSAAIIALEGRLPQGVETNPTLLSRVQNLLLTIYQNDLTAQGVTFEAAQGLAAFQKFINLLLDARSATEIASNAYLTNAADIVRLAAVRALVNIQAQTPLSTEVTDALDARLPAADGTGGETNADILSEVQTLLLDIYRGVLENASTFEEAIQQPEFLKLTNLLISFGETIVRNDWLTQANDALRYAAVTALNTIENETGIADQNTVAALRNLLTPGAETNTVIRPDVVAVVRAYSSRQFRTTHSVLIQQARSGILNRIDNSGGVLDGLLIENNVATTHHNAQVASGFILNRDAQGDFTTAERILDFYDARFNNNPNFFGGFSNRYISSGASADLGPSTISNLLVGLTALQYTAAAVNKTPEERTKYVDMIFGLVDWFAGSGVYNSDLKLVSSSLTAFVNGQPSPFILSGQNIELVMFLDQLAVLINQGVITPDQPSRLSQVQNFANDVQEGLTNHFWDNINNRYLTIGTVIGASQSAITTSAVTLKSSEGRSSKVSQAASQGIQVAQNAEAPDAILVQSMSSKMVEAMDQRAVANTGDIQAQAPGDSFDPFPGLYESINAALPAIQAASGLRALPNNYDVNAYMQDMHNLFNFTDTINGYLLYQVDDPFSQPNNIPHLDRTAMMAQAWLSVEDFDQWNAFTEQVSTQAQDIGGNTQLFADVVRNFNGALGGQWTTDPIAGPTAIFLAAANGFHPYFLPTGSEISAINQTDQAVLTEREAVGGIDLNPNNFGLESEGDTAIPMTVPQEWIGGPAEVNGFVPVIINYAPVVNLPMLLGINTSNEKPFNAAHVEAPGQLSYADRKTRFEL